MGKVNFKTIFCVFHNCLGVTEASLKKTEENLALLEVLVKDSQLESEMKDQDKKFALLQDQKFAELESLKSKFDYEILTLWCL